MLVKVYVVKEFFHPSVVDLQHQRVQQRQRDQPQVSALIISEQQRTRGQWEDLDRQKRLNPHLTAPQPPDTHNAIQSNFRKWWHHFNKSRTSVLNDKLTQHSWCLMPKLAYTQQISVFLLKYPTIFLEGSALDVLDSAVTQGLSSSTRNHMYRSLYEKHFAK